MSNENVKECCVNFIQDKYENILGSHWKKRYDLKELIETDTGSDLRAKSISDRLHELHTIESEIECFKKHFDEINLEEPKWYKDWINKIGTIKYKSITI